MKLVAFLTFLLTFQKITAEESKEFRFGHFSNPTTALNFSNVKSYFTQIQVDLEKKDVGDCENIFKNIFRIFHTDQTQLETGGYLFCKQKPVDEKNNRAIWIAFDFFVESKDTPLGLQTLEETVERIQNSTLFEEKINLYLVKNLQREEQLIAKHSYDVVTHIYKEEFFEKSHSAKELNYKSATLFSGLKISDKSSYMQFLKDKVHTKRLANWEKLFANPEVDELLFNTGNMAIHCQSDIAGETKTFYTKALFFTHKYHNTRWEFGIESDAERTGKVCLKVEALNAPAPYMALEVENGKKSFEIKNHETNCFSVSESYYMMFAINETERGILFGTRCRYVPSKKHENRTLQYRGYSGDNKCPVID